MLDIKVCNGGNSHISFIGIVTVYVHDSVHGIILGGLIMKKKLLAFISIPVVIAGICAGIVLYEKHDEYTESIDAKKYFDGTEITVGGKTIQAGGMTAEQAYGEYMSVADGAGEFTVSIGEESKKIPLDGYFKHSVSIGDFEKCMENLSFMDYLAGNGREYSIADRYSYSGGIGDAVYEYIESGEYPHVQAQDAYFDTETMTVVEEQYGTEIIPEAAAELAENSATDGIFEIKFDNDNLYRKPKIHADEVREKYAGVIKALEWTAEYSVSDYIIRLSDYKDSITVNDDGTYKVNDSFLKDAVLALSKTVDGKYDSIKFKSEKDGEITVKGGTYGQIMKNSKEIDFLKGKLKNLESVSDREPEWLCRPIDGDGNPKDYVEVDLSEQHVWHYADGKLCCDSPCVTGNVSLKRGTPEGAFYISEKIPGKYLIGADYKTWVDRWMRLTNSGVGLHDAGWKKRFGGNIYKTNGSHGCINLPVKYAYSLYDEVFVGMLVVVHG